MTPAPTHDRWSRRSLLLGAAGLGAAGLVACSAPGGPLAPGSADTPSAGAGPASPGRTPPAPPPTLPVFPGALEGAALEDRLAAYATVLLTVGRDELGRDGRRLVTAVRDQHRAHAAALRTADPTDPNSAAPSGASPSPRAAGTRPKLSKAISQLIAAEGRAAAAHRTAALAGTGTTALLWGSLATSATQLRAALTAADLAGDDPTPAAAAVAAPRPRAPMPVLPVVRAEQQLVAQLHAIVYGYQLALGRLTGSRRDTAATELRRHRILRDLLTARLLDRKADVPVAHPAYVPTTNPRNATTAATLVRQMETALLPFLGLWLAAAGTPAERREALDQLTRTAGVAGRWGAAASAWPGWARA